MKQGSINTMFTDKELQLLNSITEMFSIRAKHAKGKAFDEFMGQWYGFIISVEKGYTLSIYDYTNDLSLRDLIDELEGQIPESLRKKVISVVDPWDKRFENETNILQQPIHRKKDSPWWWYRIPKKLIGELEEDIKSSGLI